MQKVILKRFNIFYHFNVPVLFVRADCKQGFHSVGLSRTKRTVGGRSFRVRRGNNDLVGPFFTEGGDDDRSFMDMIDSDFGFFHKAYPNFQNA